jgi:hypothetical protein
MIFWKGYGILTLVIAIVVGGISSVVFSKVGSTEEMGAGVGAIISAIIIWFIGNKFNSAKNERIFIDKQTGREVIVKPNHSLFFIKMQYWAFIIGIIGLITVIGIIITGKSPF